MYKSWGRIINIRFGVEPVSRAVSNDLKAAGAMNIPAIIPKQKANMAPSIKYAKTLSQKPPYCVEVAGICAWFSIKKYAKQNIY